MQQERRLVTHEEAARPPEAAAPARLGLRPLLLGLLLVPLLVIAVEYGELVAWVGELVSTSLMLSATCALLLLLAANVVLRRWWPKRRFSRAELLYLFVMLTVAGNIAGVGMMQFIIPLLGHLFYYADTVPGWSAFVPHVPSWLAPDPAVLPGYYQGGSTFFTRANIHGWLAPLVTWSAFVAVFVTFMLCVSLLLRHQWVEKERLAFPIAAFPLELTREDTPLWRQRAAWVGVLLPVVLHSLGGLNALYPSIPYLPVKASPALNIGRYFGGGIFEPLQPVTLAFYPMAIGIAYFAELDVLFSCWFFYWLARAEEVGCVALGFRGALASPGLAEMPYLNQQSLGAFVALGATALWLARADLRAAVRHVLRRSEDDPQELGVRTAAVAGAVLCGLLLTGFCLATGIPLRLTWLFFGIYFLVVLGYSRIRAQAGLPWLFGPNHPPHIFMIWSVGPSNVSRQALTGLTYLQWFDWDYRGTTMPHQMEALKVSSSAGLSTRDMGRAILSASVLATIIAPIVILAIYYHLGAESAKVEDYRTTWAAMPLNLAATWDQSVQGVGWNEIAGGAAGAAAVVGLGALRGLWLWWPFHPVGYALSCTFTLQWLWCPLFVTWLAKLLVLRYGGMRLYRQGIPFAIGLILGDYLAAVVWVGIGLATGTATYSVFWG